MNLDLLFIIYAGIFGLLVGSFSNVLIWRLPRKESIAFPPSHCPKCDHALSPLDLVPVFSWLFLRGKCRYCKTPISPRYPIIETLSGLGYALMMFLFPYGTYGLVAVGLMLLFTILLVGSAIDIDTYTLPDELTIPSIGFGIIFAFIHQTMGINADGVLSIQEALYGAMFGAGLLALVDLLGSLIMRRFKERQYPDFPIGYQQIALGLLVGAWAGPVWALGAATLSMALNLIRGKLVRLPESVLILGFFVSLVLKSTSGPELVQFLGQALAGTGAVAILAGIYWWVHRLIIPESEEEADAPFDPIAMGFGDVKLMAGIGAFLGWQAVLFTLAIATVVGALFGLLQMLRQKENRIKFGPFLAVGAVIYLICGQQMINWYLNQLGLG